MNCIMEIPLARLLLLASPALPVGAYSYSQGLESAVEAGVVGDRTMAQNWIGDALDNSIARVEAPIFLRLIESWRAHDYAAVARWNGLFLASRETSELRSETLQLGYSLGKLLVELEGTDEKTRAQLVGLEEVSLPTAFACAAAQWNIPTQSALVAYLWSWVENQVMAAVKLVPLGQTDGQRILWAIGEKLLMVAERARSIDDDNIGAFTPRLTILSSRHETQYSRLFRS